MKEWSLGRGRSQKLKKKERGKVAQAAFPALTARGNHSPSGGKRRPMIFAIDLRGIGPLFDPSPND
jgi:hypothetical protein